MAGDLQCINPVTMYKAQSRPVLASPSSTSSALAAAQPRRRGSADKAPHARSRRPEPPQPSLPAPSQGGARRSTGGSRQRKRGQSPADPHPEARTPARSRAPSATDKTPKKSLPKKPPRPGRAKDGAGCQRRRCGGTGRPAQPFVVCAAADEKGEELNTPRTHTQTHPPRVPARRPRPGRLPPLTARCCSSGDVRSARWGGGGRAARGGEAAGGGCQRWAGEREEGKGFLGGREDRREEGKARKKRVSTTADPVLPARRWQGRGGRRRQSGR